MVRMTEAYYAPIEANLYRYFEELFWRDILDLLEDPLYRLNSSNALIDAIRGGRVWYSGGVFRGQFSAAISKELSAFASYDARAREWKGVAPPAVNAAASVANARSRELNAQIRDAISIIEARVASEIDRMRYSIDAPLFAMAGQAQDDLKGLGISIDMTPELSQKLIDEYTTNQNLNVKNWAPQQIERMRDMVEKDALAGFNREELRRRIASEYEVTMNKARFLARQETSLFMTTVRDERYRSGGIEIVQWSNSHDVRVVGNPAGLYPKPTAGHGNHWFLGGKYCKLSDPTVYADTLEDAKAGRWKSKVAIGAGTEHAGREFQCRCTYKPVIV